MRILILSYFILVTMDFVAQPKNSFIMIPSAQKRLDGHTVIDTAYLRAYYAFNAENINDIKSYIDLQCLEIGRCHSKYYSWFIYTSDSLCEAWRKERPRAQNVPIRMGDGGKYPNRWSEYQYSVFYKTNRYITEYARMPFALERYDSWYTEPYPLQQWEIQSDTLMICGYLCQKAICSFRKRDFIAWFTPDIPVSNGPWKFGGLPGLILKISDKDNLYTFECIKISQASYPIKKANYSKYKEMERTKVVELQKKINENYLKMCRAIDRETKQPMSRYTPYEPLELE